MPANLCMVDPMRIPHDPRRTGHRPKVSLAPMRDQLIHIRYADVPMYPLGGPRLITDITCVASHDIIQDIGPLECSTTTHHPHGTRLWS